MAKLNDVAVLNAPAAAAADIDFGKGLLDLQNGGTTGDDIEGISMKDVTSFTRTAYAVGTAQVDDVDFNGITAAGTYSISVEHNDELRTYSVTFAAATTAAVICAELVKEFARYAGAVQYTAAVNATDDVQITMSTAGIANGAMSTTSASATGVSTGTPYVAPSGTVGELSKLTPKTLLAGGQYTKISVIWNKLVSHNGVSGLKVYREVETLVYVEENATNYTAFADGFEDILDGSAIAAIGDVPAYLGR
jgi:hypothetical protein